MATKVIINEDGSRAYEKSCKLCRKAFVAEKPSQVYCCEQHKVAYAKRRTSKAKSGKKYTKKYEVERAIANAGRSLARRYAILAITPYDALTGVEHPIEEMQVHHLDLNWLNNSTMNLVWLTPDSHAKVHKMLDEEFEINSHNFVEFAKHFENFEEDPILAYEKERELRDKIVKFQLERFNLRKGVPTPVFNKDGL